MTTASGIPAFIDKLVAIGTAAFGSTSPVEVFDGPGVSQDDTGQQLWIGVASPLLVTDEAATSEQTWPVMGTRHTRNEEMTVHCLALAWNGDDDCKTVRDLAFAQVQAFTDAIVADPSLTQTVLVVRSPASGVALTQGRNQAGGIEAQVAFDITAQIRL